MSVEAPNLLRLSAEELDQLFRSSEAGPIPSGEAHGTVLVRPGTNRRLLGRGATSPGPRRSCST